MDFSVMIHKVFIILTSALISSYSGYNIFRTESEVSAFAMVVPATCTFDSWLLTVIFQKILILIIFEMKLNRKSLVVLDFRYEIYNTQRSKVILKIVAVFALTSGCINWSCKAGRSRRRSNSSFNLKIKEWENKIKIKHLDLLSEML